MLVIAGFHHHNSPASLVWTACVFTVFSRLQLSSVVSKVVAWIAPTTFGIFLLHSTLTGGWLRKTVIDFTATYLGVYAGYLITTIIVFLVCCFVDKMREGILKCLHLKK